MNIETLDLLALLAGTFAIFLGIVFVAMGIRNKGPVLGILIGALCIAGGFVSTNSMIIYLWITRVR